MRLENNTELAWANLDLTDPVLESVSFDDSDLLEGSSSTPTDIDPQVVEEEEEEEEESSDEFVDSGMEEDEAIYRCETLHSSILIYTFCIHYC